MDKKLLFILLLVAATCFAQKSVEGKLTLRKSDDKEFILRNTKVMLVHGTKTDSVAIAGDLTFHFAEIESDSATIYLKSPVLSPNAATKFELRKHKPTKLKLDYHAIHSFTTAGEKAQKEHNDFLRFNNAMIGLQLLGNLFVLISAMHK